MADLALKYAHLSNRDSPARKANREALREHIEAAAEALAGASGVAERESSR
jgi:hypothetical protein